MGVGGGRTQLMFTFINPPFGEIQLLLYEIMAGLSHKLLADKKKNYCVGMCVTSMTRLERGGSPLCSTVTSPLYSSFPPHVLLVESLEGLGVDEVVELDGLVGAATSLRRRFLLRLRLRLLCLL